MANKRWRAKRYRVNLPAIGQLSLVLRRFTTRPERRSKRYSQRVFHTPFGNIKEICVQRRKPSSKSRTEASRLRSNLTLVPYASLIILGVVGSIVCIARMQTAALELPAPSQPAAHSHVSATVQAPPSLPRSTPTAISIPSQQISASVMSVGQAADGTIQMPPLFDWTTGWYDRSPTPGEIGPAIIVGHVDNTRNISVFWRLRYVVAGDKIYISRADGSTATFTVTAIQQFDQANFPTQAVYGNIPYAGLRLITCGGTFNEQTKSYNQNTVVFAQLD